MKGLRAERALRAMRRFGLKALTVLAWPPAMLVAFLVGLLAFPVAPIALLFAKTTGAYGRLVVGRDGGTAVALRRLPRWARWLETQDDQDGLLPGGLYEPSIREALLKGGWYWASLRWLWRNRAYRVAYKLGFHFDKPVSAPSADELYVTLAQESAREALTVCGRVGLALRDGTFLRMWEWGEARAENPHVPGLWIGTMALYARAPALSKWTFEVLIVTPRLFGGRCLWFPIGWHIKPYFDSVAQLLRHWPEKHSASGRVAFPIRTERVPR